MIKPTKEMIYIQTFELQCRAKTLEQTTNVAEKVALLRYTERLKFRFQSWNSDSKQKPHRRLGTRWPSS